MLILYSSQELLRPAPRDLSLCLANTLAKYCWPLSACNPFSMYPPSPPPPPHLL